MSSDSGVHLASTPSSDGTVLAFLCTGDRQSPPLVLLHGWAQSARCWGPEVIARLADTFYVLAPDLRGHGYSEIPDTGYDSSQQWADDVAAILDAAQIQQGAIIVGWSYGGIVLSDYLAHYGEDRVAGIVLCGAATSIGRSRSGRVGPAMMQVADGAFESDPRRAIAALSRFGSAMMTVEDGVGRQRLFGLSLATPPEVRRKMLDRTVNNDEVLAQLTIPALVLHGADDGVVLPVAGRTNAELIPSGRYVELPQCAHAPFIERPEDFVSEIAGFASECAAG